MDGMTYHRHYRSAPAARRYGLEAKLTAAAITAAVVAGMIGLALLLHTLGWAPPDIDQLGC